MLKHLRDLSISTGSRVTMRIIAMSHQGDSPASTALTYSIPAYECSAISFKAMPDLELEDVELPEPTEEELIEEVETVEDEDFGIDKQEDVEEPVEEVIESVEETEEEVATENDDEDEIDEESVAGAINLKATGYSMSAPEEEAQEAEGDEALAFILGVIVTLGVQVMIAGGYYAYTKYNTKKSVTIPEISTEANDRTIAKLANSSTVVDNEKNGLDEMVQAVKA